MINKNKKPNESFTESLAIAGSFAHRFRGLFSIGKNQGCLLLTPCRSIHTFGMRHPVEVAFFDRWGVVLKAGPVLPGRVSFCRGAEGVVERMVGEESAACAGRPWFRPGDRLFITDGTWDTVLLKGDTSVEGEV